MALTKVSYSMINGEVANVLDYGADPTGVSDSTTAITLAIASGKAVFIPKGTYITDTLSLPNTASSGVVINGENKESTILVAKNTNSPIFNSAGSFSSNNYISNLTLRAHASSSTGPAVDMRNISFSQFVQIIVQGNGSGKWAQAFYFYAYTSPFSHCYLNQLDYINISDSCITDTVFLMQDFCNANRISHVQIRSAVGGSTLSIPYVVRLYNPNAAMQLLTLEKFHVECNLTQFAFDFGNGNTNITLRDSWVETNAQSLNNSNTSTILLQNSHFNGSAWNTVLPVNFSRISCDVTGVVEGAYANVSQPTQAIVFTSTATPSSNTRALDDYDEGTWNPSLSGVTGLTLTNSYGFYRKIGGVVYVSFYIQANWTSSAAVSITGLPYTSLATSFATGWAVTLSTQSAQTGVVIVGNIGNTATTIVLSNANALNAAWVAPSASPGYLAGSGFYFAT